MTRDRSWRVRAGLVLGVVALLAWGAAVGTARGRRALGVPVIFEREAPSETWPITGHVRAAPAASQPVPPGSP